jgi:hypothetical protein
MADYDQYGNPIPPADAEAAREGVAPPGTSSDPMSPDYVSPEVVTITAPATNSSWIGMAIIAGLLYFLLTGESD